MAIVVGGVLRLGADMDQHQHNQVGGEIRQRMHGIGNHCRTVTQHARHKLEQHQSRVGGTAHKRHFIYFPFTLHFIHSHSLYSFPPRRRSIKAVMSAMFTPSLPLTSAQMGQMTSLPPNK